MLWPVGLIIVYCLKMIWHTVLAYDDMSTILYYGIGKIQEYGQGPLMPFITTCTYVYFLYLLYVL